MDLLEKLNPQKTFCDANNNPTTTAQAEDEKGNVILATWMKQDHYPKCSSSSFLLQSKSSSPASLLLSPDKKKKLEEKREENDEIVERLMYFTAESVQPEDLIKSGSRARVTVNDTEVALISHENVLYAVQERCPHSGGPLHMGEIEDVPDCGPCIKCPWHSWTFSLATGKCIAPKERELASNLETFPVRLKRGGELSSDEIQIGFGEISPKIFVTPPN